MSHALQTAPCYPFNLDGPLCPLLNDAEILSAFYAEEGLRHGIKQFCKKAAWPGKPAISFAINPEKLQELLLSLFNSPVARATLSKQSAAGRGTYLDNAIWQWLTVVNRLLAQWVSGVCDEIKGKFFMKPEALQKLVAEMQKEQADVNAIKQLAFIVLAFAMLQPDDRYRFGETFLSAFPEYAEKFGGAESAVVR